MKEEIMDDFDDLEIDPEFGEVFCDMTDCTYCDRDGNFCQLQKWDCQARMDMEINGIL